MQYKKYVFVGDSWALRGFTNDNFIYNAQIMPNDVRLADYIGLPYQHCIAGGQSNLFLLNKLIEMNLPVDQPILWIYTEPGRDYNNITGNPEFEWIESKNIFEIRKMLDQAILQEIKNKLPNPVAFVGGLSDVNTSLATNLGFTVLHNSWQSWIAQTLKSQWFKFGWGAADIGWRFHSNNVKPSKTALFEWDEQIKEWCWWEEQGYFCHEHPTPRANKEFAEFLKPKLEDWLSKLL